MAETYEPIETQTLTSNASSITFGSGGTLPQTYTDLIIVSQSKLSADSGDFGLRFNGDTGTNYSAVHMSAAGGSTTANYYVDKNYLTCTYYGYMETDYGVYIVQIPNYVNSTTYKTVLARANTISNGVGAGTGLWRSTNAITSVTVIPFAGSTNKTLASGSVFTLYGIKAA